MCVCVCEHQFEIIKVKSLGMKYNMVFKVNLIQDELRIQYFKMANIIILEKIADHFRKIKKTLACERFCVWACVSHARKSSGEIALTTFE